MILVSCVCVCHYQSNNYYQMCTVAYLFTVRSLVVCFAVFVGRSSTRVSLVIYLSIYLFIYLFIVMLFIHSPGVAAACLLSLVTP